MRTADLFMMEMAENIKSICHMLTYESWRMHMKQMSYSDMECQCDYIRLSMEMLKASDGKKKMFPTRIRDITQIKSAKYTVRSER